jgi:hypothetical protein
VRDVKVGERIEGREQSEESVEEVGELLEKRRIVGNPGEKRGLMVVLV